MEKHQELPHLSQRAQSLSEQFLDAVNNAEVLLSYLLAQYDFIRYLCQSPLCALEIQLYFSCCGASQASTLALITHRELIRQKRSQFCPM